MTVFDPNPALVWLFCSAHPDDELAVGGWIARLSSLGVQVHLAWAHCTKVRQKEAMSVARHLGVPEERLSFAELPDGRLVDHMHELRDRWSELFEQVKPDRVASVAFEQGHLDHEAVHWAVRRAWVKPSLEWPMYHTYLHRFPVINRFSDPTGEQVLRLTRKEAHQQYRRAKLYASQTVARNVRLYNLLRLAVRRDQRLLFSERMRWTSRDDFRTPAVREPHLSRVLASSQWARWIEALDKAEGKPPVG